MKLKRQNIKDCSVNALIYACLFMITVALMHYIIGNHTDNTIEGYILILLPLFAFSFILVFVWCNILGFVYSHINDFHKVSLLIITTFVFDRLFEFFNIPITFFDLIIIFATAASAFYYFKHKKKNKHKSLLQESAKFDLKTVLTLLLFILLGVGVIYMGVIEPFEVSTGIKLPPVHGYSMALLGLTITVFFVLLLISLFKQKP